MKFKNHYVFLGILFVFVLLLRLVFVKLIPLDNKTLSFLGIFLSFIVGVYLIKQTAGIIEKTTAILKTRTGLAGGLLQSLGTAFPDMVIGVLSAILSLKAASTDPLKAINLAIIAASTTFGSNIYNIFHAVWCVSRQNLANKTNKMLLMFPSVKTGGMVLPFSQQTKLPPKKDVNDSITILTLLSFLTTGVVIGMVLFGKVASTPAGITGDLYRLTREVGIAIFLLCLLVLFLFRKSSHEADLDEGDNIFKNTRTVFIWLELLVAGIVILFAAESIIEAVMRFSEITGLPYVVTGVLTALVGCLGEIVVIHNFTVHPEGRIADAVIGVAMDNIVTTMGAAIIAIMGGIFLGSDALIIIFVLILFANTTLIAQISRLKNYLYGNSYGEET